MQERINANVNLNYDRSVNYFIEGTFSQVEIYEEIKTGSESHERNLNSINQLEIPTISVKKIEDIEIITIDMETDKVNGDGDGDGDGDGVIIKTKDDLDIEDTEDDTLTTKQYRTKFNKRTEKFTYTTRSKAALAKILHSGQEYGGGKKINRRKTYKRRKTKHKKTKQKKNTQKRRKTKRKKMRKGGDGPTQVLQQQSHGLFGQEPTEADLERMYEQNDKEMRDKMEKQKQMEAKTTTAAEAEAKSQQRPTNHYELFLHSMNYAIDTNKNISETYKMILTYTKINRTKLVNKTQSSLIIKMANLSETRFLLEIVKTMLDQKSGPSEGQYGGGRQILKQMIISAFSLTNYRGNAKKYVQENLKKTAVSGKIKWDTFTSDILTFAQGAGELDITKFVNKNDTGYNILDYEIDLTGFAYFLHILKNGTAKISPEDLIQLKIELLNNADYFNDMIERDKPKISQEDFITISEDGKRIIDMDKMVTFNEELKELDRIDKLSQTDNNFPAFNTNVILQTMVSNSSLLTIFMNFLTDEYDKRQNPSYSPEEDNSDVIAKIDSLINTVDEARRTFSESQSSTSDDELFEKIQNANTIEELRSIH